jgi:integrase
MANRKYRKDYLTKIKGSQNWYLQFFIKPDYRQLPYFKSNQKWAIRRNYLQTLKTPHYPEAVALANKILEDIGIRSKPLPPPLSTGTQAYFETLRDLKTRSDDDLLQLKDIFEELRNGAISEPTYPGSVEVLDEITLEHYSKALEAINREVKERYIPHYSEPYPYQITVRQLAEEYKTDLVEDGADFKAQSKLYHAVRKLLEYRGVDDIEVRLIKPKMVTEYVRHSKLLAVAEGTLRSELAMLSNIYKFGVSQEYLTTDNNPFRNVSLKGFKPKLGREPFTTAMHEMLVKAAKNDPDMSQLVQCSYYTGMRLSEVFDAGFKTISGIICFDVASAGGKTQSAKRLVPIHSQLLPILKKNYSLADGDGLRWNRQTADAVGKEFGRMKQRVLAGLGITDKAETGKYVHHSYRHGFITMMIDAGLDEMQFIDLTGHKKSYIGKTEAGKTYAGVAKIEKLKLIIELVPAFD